MHHHRYAPFIDWTDYHVHGPMRVVRDALHPRRRHRLLKLLALAVLAILVARVLNGRRRRTSWF